MRCFLALSRGMLNLAQQRRPTTATGEQQARSIH
jgi:hypothetical protein